VRKIERDLLVRVVVESENEKLCRAGAAIVAAELKCAAADIQENSMRVAFGDEVTARLRVFTEEGE
jgi:hypothetical protein